MISILFFILSLIAYSLSQLHIQRKLKWQKPGTGFFGEDSDKRKYKNFDSKQGERWPTSTNLTVSLTDFYHAAQWFQLTLFSLGIAFAFGLGLWMWLGTRILISVIHWAIYNTFQK